MTGRITPDVDSTKKAAGQLVHPGAAVDGGLPSASGRAGYRGLFKLPGAFSHTNCRRITPSVCSDLISTGTGATRAVSQV